MKPPGQLTRRQVLHAASAVAGMPLAGIGSNLLGASADRPRVSMRSPHTVQVRPHNGRTAIMVDGEAVPGMSFYGFGNEKVTNDVADTGVPIFFCAGGPFWNGPGDYDFTAFDNRVKLIDSKVKNVWLICRLNMLSTPLWWSEKNLDEVVRYAHAPDVPGEFRPEWRNPRQASMASQKWIDDAGDMLHALVRHVENGPYADRMLGYMLNSGGSEEWVYWGCQFGYVPDYSPPALRYFRDWLRLKYGKKDWIETVQIPSEVARRRGLPGMLRDPAQDALAIDYELCLSDIVADNLLAWCAVVKKATGGRRIVGSFCSYLMWQTGLVNALSTNGHLSLRRLMESPDIDYLTGITSYDNRAAGGPGSFMIPVESVQRAGKLYYGESDMRTHVLGTPHSSSRYSSNGLLAAPAKDAAESVDILRREFSHHLIHGAAWWYFDMTGGWFDAPEILAEFKKQAAIARQAVAWDMTSVAEVAGFVSGASPARHPLQRMHDINNYPRLLELQCDRATRELYRSGVLLDWLMTDDLEQPGLEHYKALFFYNATWLSEKQRAAVDALKGGGRALIFVGYPGLATDRRIDVEAAARLVGMKFKVEASRACAEIVPQRYDDAALREVKGRLQLGAGAVVGPRLVPDDDDAVVLAVWPDGLPAAAVKRHKNYTSYYFAVSPNDPDLFRTMCRDAGCFTYSTNNDILFGNRSLLAVHFSDCIQPLRLPQPKKVTNVFTGEVVLERGTTLVPKGDGATHLYRLEEPAS